MTSQWMGWISSDGSELERNGTDYTSLHVFHKLSVLTSICRLFQDLDLCWQLHLPGHSSISIFKLPDLHIQKLFVIL